MDNGMKYPLMNHMLWSGFNSCLFCNINGKHLGSMSFVPNDGEIPELRHNISDFSLKHIGRKGRSVFSYYINDGLVFDEFTQILIDRAHEIWCSGSSLSIEKFILDKKIIDDNEIQEALENLVMTTDFGVPILSYSAVTKGNQQKKMIGIFLSILLEKLEATEISSLSVFNGNNRVHKCCKLVLFGFCFSKIFEKNDFSNPDLVFASRVAKELSKVASSLNMCVTMKMHNLIHLVENVSEFGKYDDLFVLETLNGYFKAFELKKNLSEGSMILPTLSLMPLISCHDFSYLLPNPQMKNCFSINGIDFKMNKFFSSSREDEARIFGVLRYSLLGMNGDLFANLSGVERFSQLRRSIRKQSFNLKKTQYFDSLEHCRSRKVRKNILVSYKKGNSIHFGFSLYFFKCKNLPNQVFCVVQKTVNNFKIPIFDDYVKLLDKLTTFEIVHVSDLLIYHDYCCWRNNLETNRFFVL